MSTQADYTPDEWTQIVNGPVAAGTAIVMADPALFGSIKESAVMAKAIAEYGQSSSVELLQAIGEAVRGGQKYQAPDVPKDQGVAGAMKVLIGECRKAVKVVQAKSPDEAGLYSQYLLDIAHRTAEASKEGGFLGIGAVRVSEHEEAALKRLAEALNVGVDESSVSDEPVDTEA